MKKQGSKSMSAANQEKPVRSDNPPTHQDDPLLSLSEVGRQLGKSHTTIARWVQDGLLIAERAPSGLPSIRKSQVNRFLGGSALQKELA